MSILNLPCRWGKKGLDHDCRRLGLTKESVKLSATTMGSANFAQIHGLGIGAKRSRAHDTHMHLPMDMADDPPPTHPQACTPTR